MKRIFLVLSAVAILGACSNQTKQQPAEGEKDAKCSEMQKDSTVICCEKHKNDSIKCDSIKCDSIMRDSCARMGKTCCASKDSAESKKE